MQNKNKISKVMKILEKYYQHAARTTLNRMRKTKKKDAFKILISCLISLRVKDETTEKITKELFKHISKPEDLVNMPIKKLEKLIYSSGYYKNKARTLKHVSKEILKKFKGKVPNNEKELLGIKGIGRKTCNIVRGFAFNQLVIPVDVNVHRISNRLGWVKTTTADKTEQELKKILPEKYWKEINALFILHGKTICQPILPFCSKCPVNKLCPRISIVRSR